MNKFGVNAVFVNPKSINQSNVSRFILSQIERQSLKDTRSIKIRIEVFISETDRDKKTSFELITIKNYYQKQLIW